MDTLLKTVGAIAVIVVLAFFLTLFGVIGGAITGWVVGLFFTDVIIGTVARAGIDTAGLEVWHIGATLGFIGAFFKTVNTNTSK